MWPFLILTVAICGPAFYYIIAIPYWRQDPTFNIRNCLKFCGYNRRNRRRKRNRKNENLYNEVYLKEMNYGIRDVGRINRKFVDRKRIPKHLFQKCMWFAVTLFLKQSKLEDEEENFKSKDICCVGCNHPCIFDGIRAKILSSMLWLAATYVLADVYSAQLTSQLASPAREPPISLTNVVECWRWIFNKISTFRHTSTAGNCDVA